jgi:predicted O-methyltransferase YrrM
MTILVFPSTLQASVKFADEARGWNKQTVGAASLSAGANASHFDAWEQLPFIGDEKFFDELRLVVERHDIKSLFTPHAPTFHLLERELPSQIPQIALIGEGPFQKQMKSVQHWVAEGERAKAVIFRYGESAADYPVEFLAGTLMTAETIHGECSREKIFALCGIARSAPKGDVVEIGALYGKSSYVLNRLASYNNLGTTLCVDPWDLALTIQYDASRLIQQASQSWDWNVVHSGFLINMLGCGTAPLGYLRTTSSKAFNLYETATSITSAEFGTVPLSGQIAILHLDGNHDEAAVSEDYALWSRRLAPGGWIVFDDYHWPHGDGPRKVADSAIKQLGQQVQKHFVAGGAMFIKLAMS